MKKVLIANRGEIAVRIIRACHDLGLKTVAVYSKADTDALHVKNADEAICIGESSALKSYLKIPNILAACEVSGADAVHPGYGFLSENPNFASICESCGLNFIGPSSEAIALLGDKFKAKITAKETGCPVIPGSSGVIDDFDHALKEAQKIGFPLLIKAVAGGGGKGIRVVTDEEKLKKQFVAARSEAEACFNNPHVYLEKIIMTPRHVEVQVLADKHGNCVYLGERDCTIQRRRQKLIEEAPCPILTPDLRKKLGKAAVRIAKRANYFSVGTVEFLLDRDMKFYFMEMNTRLQVEHTISEELTGIDLVIEQLKVAQGKPLIYKQKDIVCKGHSIQFRINAENPKTNFSPSPGKLTNYAAPGGPAIRVDSACYSGYTIPPHYDSMVAKLIVNGENRKEAIKKATRALKEFHIEGIHSTIPFHLYIIREKAFKESNYDLDYIDNLINAGCEFEL